jgi:hypothetical protein
VSTEASLIAISSALRQQVARFNSEYWDIGTGGSPDQSIVDSHIPMDQHIAHTDNLALERHTLRQSGL